MMFFPIVVYRSEDGQCAQFTAHCLNLDIIADDDTIEGAISELLESIEASLEAAKKHNASPFREAPKKYWDWFSQAQPLARELWERILFNANRRLGMDKKRAFNLEKQTDVRQAELV